MLIPMVWRVLVNAASHGDWGSGRRENRREKTKSKGTGDEGERAAPPPTACLHASLTSAERTVARPQVCMDVPGLETRRSRPCASGTDEVRQSRK